MASTTNSGSWLVSWAPLGALAGALGLAIALPAGATSHAATHSIVGRVASIGSNSFTLSLGTKRLTVEVSGATRFVEPGIASPSLSNLESGGRVGVVGSPVATSSDEVRASRVFIVPPHSSATIVTVSGTVQATSSSGFSLLGTGGVVDVDVDSSTQYYEQGVTNPGRSTVQVGLNVSATGRHAHASAGGVPTLDARGVLITASSSAAHLSGTSGGSESSGAPTATAAGELPPGGIASDIGTDGFDYRNGSASARVVIESYTRFYLNGVATTEGLSLLGTSGVTVGTSGTADPASTASARIIDAIHVYLSTSPPTTTTPPTTTLPPSSGVPRGTAAGELAPGGTASNIGRDGFTYENGSTTVRVVIESYTTFYLDGVATSEGLSLLGTSGVTVGTSGSADPASTASAPIVDAIHVYLSTSPPPTTTPPTTTPPTTLPSSSGVPRGTAAGELPPGGTASDLSDGAFTYENGSTTVRVVIESYTTFYLNGTPLTSGISLVLTEAGTTVGTSGTADPASTASAPIVDAIHVYLTRS